MSKRKLTYEERIEAARKYKAGKGSRAKIASKYGISEKGLRNIILVYESQGCEGLMAKGQNNKYSKEIKLQAVTEYLSGQGSQDEICKKHKISSPKLLRNWIKVYNGHKGFRNHSNSRTEIYMTIGRKTNQQERAEIVAFCIAHGKDYALTIQTYGVSYQQIYAWVRKYEAKGIDGLTDRRGKAKPENEMTETDKLKAQIKIRKLRIMTSKWRTRS